MNILLVEDNLGDVVFFREAMQALRVEAELTNVDNGQDAVDYLRRKGRFADASDPDVIVLDLNIPVRNGQEVLEELAKDHSLGNIPVVVLTTSASECHVVNICPPGRCLYFVKTDDFQKLQQIVRKIVLHGLAG